MEGRPIRHVVSARQFKDPEQMLALFERAQWMKEMLASPQGRRGLRTTFAGETAVVLFWEPSTRTRTSFELAAKHLGMSVTSTENAAQFSSTIKGETLPDTIRVMSGYHPSVVVMRHTQSGSAQIAADCSTVPIINAGDGSGEHPSQALLDLFTIQQELGRLENLRVAVVGDLRYGRTVRSLMYLLTRFPNIHFTCIAPQLLSIEPELIDYCRRHGATVVETEDFVHGISNVDVIYMTRIQKERLPDPTIHEETRGRYAVTARTMRELGTPAIIMHPLPRNEEIAPEVDADPRAAYFRQAENGLYVRMALLEWVLDGTPK